MAAQQSPKLLVEVRVLSIVQTMKRLFMLFTMLFCFSIAGICKTTVTDLSENSKQNTELVSYSDVVKADFVLKANQEALVMDHVDIGVPESFGDKNIITASLFTANSTAYKTDVVICIRDKIRIV